MSASRTTTGPGVPPIPAGLGGVQHSGIDLPTGRLDIAHPREAITLVYEQNFGADGQEPPYWALPWPCGVELARAVAAAVPEGKRVLELGCGLALPSMAAALGGAKVLATDRAADAVAFAAYNARRNGIALDVATCDWTDPVAAVVGDPVGHRSGGRPRLPALGPRRPPSPAPPADRRCG